MAPNAAGEKKERGNRTVVGISDETATRLDALSERAGRQTRETLGYSVTPSRGDIVSALVKDAYEREPAAA